MHSYLSADVCCARRPDMEKKSLFVFTVLLQAFVLRSCLGVFVRFPNQQPVYIVSGTDLLLQAQIEQLPRDHTKSVTWQHQQKQNSEKKTVAEYPAKTSGGRVTLEKDGTVLKLRNYQSSDSGIYTITVTDQKGGQVSAQCTVLEYEAVHHVSVMVNVSHTSLHCREAWGTDPVFSWLHEKTAVTEQVGTVSPDGSSLYLSMPLCGHFTCLVSNKLGHSSATYTAEPCEKTRSGTAIAVVCLTLLLLLAGGLAFMLWRRHRDHSSRGERLQESFEDVV